MRKKSKRNALIQKTKLRGANKGQHQIQYLFVKIRITKIKLRKNYDVLKRAYVDQNFDEWKNGCKKANKKYNILKITIVFSIKKSIFTLRNEPKFLTHFYGKHRFFIIFFATINWL